MKIQSVKDIEKISRAYKKQMYTPEGIKVNIGMASCGIAAGAETAFKLAIEKYSGNSDIKICQTGCIGFCEMEPLVEMLASGKPRMLYKHITEDKIIDAIARNIYAIGKTVRLINEVKSETKRVVIGERSFNV